MAGNTRGRLKERFESVHRDFEWAKRHLSESLVLIKDHKPNLSGAITTLASAVDELDKLAQGIYSKL